jgi:hypothetical protein
MTKRFPYIAPIAIIIVMAVFAAIVASYAPAGTRLAFHWSTAGKADGFANPWKAMFTPVVLCAVFSLLFALLGRLLKPLPELIDGTLLFMIVYELMIAAQVFGITIPQGLSPLLAVIGLVYIMMGNDMPKWRSFIRPPVTLDQINYSVGISRFRSRLWIISGLVFIVCGLLPLDPAVRTIVTRSALWSAILVPVIYSWSLGRL